MSALRQDDEEVSAFYSIHHPSLTSTYPVHEHRSMQQQHAQPVYPPHSYQIPQMPPFPATSYPYTAPQYPPMSEHQYSSYCSSIPQPLPLTHHIPIGYAPQSLAAVPPHALLPKLSNEEMMFVSREDFPSLIEEIIGVLEKDPKAVEELKFVLFDLVPCDQLRNLNDVASILDKMMEKQLLSENNVGYLENYLKISYESLSKRLLQYRQFSDSVTKPPLPAPAPVHELRPEESQLIHQRTQPIPRGPVDSGLLCYSMQKRPHGVCAIFNNSNFTTDVLGTRNGSEIDRDRLNILFTSLQYKVEVYNDLTADELYMKLGQISKQDHTHFDSFICCILTHGADNDTLYGSDGQQLHFRNVHPLFYGKNAKTLFGKPKIFFIQACRGDMEDRGYTSRTMDEDSHQDSAYFDSSDLPDTADFLFAYPTSSGFVSWRSHNEGTWYIKALCDQLKQCHNDYDLLSILTMVNNKVAERRTSEGYKQMPAPVNHLRKQVFIRT